MTAHDEGLCPSGGGRCRECRCLCRACYKRAVKREADTCTCVHCITNRDILANAHGRAPTIVRAAHPSARGRTVRGWSWDHEGWCARCERLEPLVQRADAMVLAPHKAGGLGTAGNGVSDIQQCPGSGKPPWPTPSATAPVPEPGPEADADKPDHRTSGWIG